MQLTLSYQEALRALNEADADVMTALATGDMSIILTATAARQACAEQFESARRATLEILSAIMEGPTPKPLKQALTGPKGQRVLSAA